MTRLGWCNQALTRWQLAVGLCSRVLVNLTPFHLSTPCGQILTAGSLGRPRNHLGTQAKKSTLFYFYLFYSTLFYCLQPFTSLWPSRTASRDPLSPAYLVASGSRESAFRILTLYQCFGSDVCSREGLPRFSLFINVLGSLCRRREELPESSLFINVLHPPWARSKELPEFSFFINVLRPAYARAEGFRILAFYQCFGSAVCWREGPSRILPACAQQGRAIS